MTTRLVLLLAVAQIAQPAAFDEVLRGVCSAKTFMGTVLVARGSGVLFTHACGFASLEWQVPNTAGSVFRIGSVSKQFTAAAVLLLEERGKLSVDDPLRKHVPEAPETWNDVRIHHLLTHTSGIFSITSLSDFNELKVRRLRPEQSMRSVYGRPLEFKPGESYRYSNSGYLLLAMIIERAGGQTYEEFLRRNIFEPLAMRDSGSESTPAIVARRASGYSPSFNGPANAAYVDMNVPIGGGSLFSTVEDLHRWNLALFGGKLLSPASLKKMTTAVLKGYGYGIAVSEENGRKRFGHDGGIEGFNSTLLYYPDSRMTVVVLSNLNTRDTGRIARDLAAVAHNGQ
jgi:CubicO group peptidase (beta-lactamase class C family)